MTSSHAAAGGDARTAARDYDAVVVGSGMGGLTCGSLLAQLLGWRVLVLERHWRLGGFTQSFERPGGAQWDVGLHYVGQMEEHDPVRALMDLVTDQRVQWSRMPDTFERYEFPGRRIDQPAGRAAYTALLRDQWPRQADALQRYFSAVEAAFQQYGARVLAYRAARAPRERGGAPPLRGLAGVTTREAFDTLGVDDVELRGVLAAQWCNYGLPPGESAFMAHALIVRHFLEGGWFPQGGAGALVAAMRGVIEAAGGACLTSHDVERVLRGGGRAIGVRVARGPAGRRELVDCLAPVVISDVGANGTFRRLLDEVDPGVDDSRGELDAFPTGSSIAQLFLSLSASPAGLGVRGENLWMFESFDQDENYARRNRMLRGVVPAAYASFASLRDPSAGNHTVQVIAPIDHTMVAPWADARWRRRGAGYDAAKEAMTAALLDTLERHLPGIRPLVQHAELATPLTVETFTGHRHGHVYGLPSVPARFTARCLTVETPLRGLLLTGCDVASAGIVGALLGGVATVAHILGTGGLGRVIAVARDAKRHGRIATSDAAVWDRAGVS